MRSSGPTIRVERLRLARLTRAPEWHPERAAFPLPVHAWLVRHPDGPIVVDTGVGSGHEAIDDWYGPEVTPVADALGAVGVAAEDVVAIVISHLHFDHCGQQAALSAPVHVQRAEAEVAASEARYTVPEWAAVAPDRLHLVDGDTELVPGVRLLATPGHTPGHQSVVIDTEGGRVVLGAQCAFRADEVHTGEPSAANVHDPSWEAAARASLTRVRDLAPCVVELSHDERPVPLG
jgi:N-acyl homoserine lactone hydrolase